MDWTLASTELCMQRRVICRRSKVALDKPNLTGFLQAKKTSAIKEANRRPDAPKICLHVLLGRVQRAVQGAHLLAGYFQVCLVTLFLFTTRPLLVPPA